MRWAADLLGKSSKQLSREMATSTPGDLARLWEKAAPESAAEVMSFYRSREVGKLYLLDLLKWNGSTTFKQIQEPLTSYRGRLILEIGSGIGTVAIQLAARHNQVVAVEPNDVLRAFAQDRWDKESGKVGSIAFTPNLPESGNYDLCVAIDVFEHLHQDTLIDALGKISKLLSTKGRVYMHNNWGQQHIYPMHYDHSGKWPDYVKDARLFRLSSQWLIKL